MLSAAGLTIYANIIGPTLSLVIELSERVRMRLSSADQIELAARLLQALNAPAPC